MTTSNKIVIEASKSKLVKLLLFSILFIIGGIWMVMVKPQGGNFFLNNPIAKAIAGYSGIILGLLGAFFFSKKFFDKKPGLVIDENGIDENSGAFDFGLIPWRDIISINELTIQVSVSSKQQFVTIGLKDPDDYILKAKNPIKRKLMKANLSGYGSPIHISANSLKTTHNELFTMLFKAFEQYKTVA